MIRFHENKRIKEEHIAGESLVKGTVKVFPVHAVKAYRGSRGIAPLILNLRTS
jgi:hypothetical protein